jgi:hypothetical protein
MPAIGIMDEAVANNANGHMVIVGTITELNTTGLTVNAERYVAAGGGFTATPPTARAQPVARVERVNANNGAVIVKVNGLSASDATGNTLVRRDSSGDASFGKVNATQLDVSGVFEVSEFNPVTFGLGSELTFNGTSYTYGTGAASAHRIALGAGTTGSELFGAATAAAARTTLEMVGKTIGSPVLGAGWVDNGDGTYTCTAGAQGSTLELPFSGITDGKLYLIRYNMIAVSGSGNITTYLGIVNSLDLATQGFSARGFTTLWIKRAGSANQLTFRVASTLTGAATIADVRLIELPF